MSSTSIARRIACATVAASLALPAGSALARSDYPIAPSSEPTTAPAPPVRVTVDDAGIDWPSAGLGGGVIALAALGAAGTTGLVRRRHHRLAS